MAMGAAPPAGAWASARRAICNRGAAASNTRSPNPPRRPRGRTLRGHLAAWRGTGPCCARSPSRRGRPPAAGPRYIPPAPGGACPAVPATAPPAHLRGGRMRGAYARRAAARCRMRAALAGATRLLQVCYVVGVEHGRLLEQPERLLDPAWGVMAHTPGVVGCARRRRVCPTVKLPCSTSSQQAVHHQTYGARRQAAAVAAAQLAPCRCSRHGATGLCDALSRLSRRSRIRTGFPSPPGPFLSA